MRIGQYTHCRGVARPTEMEILLVDVVSEFKSVTSIFQGRLGGIMHLIPILIFLGLSLLTSLMVQDPPYSFSISG